MPQPLMPQPTAFPVKGLHESVGFDMQPEGTSPDETNVRSFDTILDRLRGGSRPGMEKWATYPLQVNGSNTIQLIQQVVRSIAQETDTRYLAGYGSVSTANGVVNGEGTLVSLFNSIIQNLTNPNLTSPVTAVTREYVTSIVVDDDGTFYVAVANPNYAGDSAIGDALITQVFADGSAGWAQFFNYGITGGHGIEPVLALSPDFDTLYVGTAPTDGWLGTDNSNRNLFAIDTSNGHYIWKVLTSAGYTINAIAATDDATGPSLRLVVTQYNLSANTANHVLLRNGDDGTGLASWNFNSNTSGFRLAVHYNGTYVTVAGIRSNDSWTAHSSEANIFTFTITGATLNALTLSQAYRIGCGSSDNPANTGIPAVAMSSDDAYIVYAGQRIQTINLTKFKTSDSTIIWTQNLGKGADELSLWAMTLTDTGALIGGVRTNNWVDADGEFASLWYVDYTNGKVIWHQDPAALDAGEPVGGHLGRVYTVAIFGSGAVPSTRQTALLPVSGGTIVKIDEAGVRTVPVGGSNVLAVDMHAVQSTAAYNHAFFVDGTHNKKYNLNDDTVSTWTASTAGTLPTGQRLIVTWRGRIVGAGVVSDPHNYFMSKSGDPFDYDYSPTTPNALQAVAGNNSDAGLVGDIITGLLPLSDDVLIFGGDHTLYKMTGDPAAGGVVDLLSDQTGMAFGRAWCKDPDGIAYFVGTDGIYRVTKEGLIENMTSSRWARRFASIDQSLYRAYMVWDYAHHTLIVEFMSLVGKPNLSFVWEKRADAWHPQEYPTAIGPTSLLAYDGPKASDKATMLGGKDGYIRTVKDGVNDDGIDISSDVRFAPFIAPSHTAEVVLNSVQPILANNSAGSTFLNVYTGQSAEDCVTASAPRVRRLLTHAGRNHSLRQKVRGYAVQLGISSTTVWGFEGMAVGFESSGMPRQEVKAK